MTQIAAYNPFFEVARQPLYTEFNGEKIFAGRDGLINSVTGEMVGVVAPKYKLVENAHVAGVFEEAFADLPILRTVDHGNGTGSKWIRDIILDGDQFTKDIDGQGDEVKTKVRIWNGYDGRTAVGFAISAWRQVCSNGMFGWKDLFGANFAHIEDNIVEKIRNIFNVQFDNFNNNFTVWEEWSDQPFGQEEFDRFIDYHTKENIFGNKDAYLSEKQAEGIKGLYIPVMNEYNEGATKWGAYNVLTAIGTHHTKARKGSNLFSAAHGRMERLANDFYKYGESSERALVLA